MSIYYHVLRTGMWTARPRTEHPGEIEKIPERRVVGMRRRELIIANQLESNEWHGLSRLLLAKVRSSKQMSRGVILTFFGDSLRVIYKFNMYSWTPYCRTLNGFPTP